MLRVWGCEKWGGGVSRKGNSHTKRRTGSDICSSVHPMPRVFFQWTAPRVWVHSPKQNQDPSTRTNGILGKRLRSRSTSAQNCPLAPTFTYAKVSRALLLPQPRPLDLTSLFLKHNQAYSNLKVLLSLWPLPDTIFPETSSYSPTLSKSL